MHAQTQFLSFEAASPTFFLGEAPNVATIAPLVDNPAFDFAQETLSVNGGE